ncbi:unnamed protein product [Chilo suppressalis]|uniref:Uncharacterized protein n=1 Tax=Chilo suppressalis TaxID=168631 RepID=A0ABN8ASB7_CHISP|nr:unnamed protein product [Chilo suppressalis]
MARYDPATWPQKLYIPEVQKKDYQPECGRNEKSEILAENSFAKDLGFKEEMASSRLYRPRSALARALYEKQRNDRHLQELDKNEWYRVDKTRLSPELQSKFVQLNADEETKEFLSSSIDKSTWVWTQLWYLLAKAVLKHFWSITDINGSLKIKQRNFFMKAS